MHNTVQFPSAFQRKGCGCPRFFVFPFLGEAELLGEAER
jgi:hypothetical protein